MPQATRPELDTLLARAAAFGTVSQAIWCPTPEEAVGFVINAIRCCILPCDLIVLSDDVPRLRLAASGGHIQRVLPGTEADAPLIDRPLDPASGADPDAVAELLQRLFPGEQSLSVKTAPATAAPDALSPGLSCPALLARLNMMRFGAAVPDPLDYFIAAAEEVLFAVLRPGAEPDIRDTRAPLPKALLDQARHMLATADGPRALLEGDRLLCLQPEGPFGLALALEDGGPVALIVEAGCLPDLAALWAGMRHGVVACRP